MRRTLIIGAVVIVLAGIGVGAYFYFFSGSPGVAVAPAGSTILPVAGQNTPTTTQTPSPVAEPVAVSARLVKISAGPVVPGEVVINKKVVNASSSPETTVNFIERESGNVFSYLVGAGTLTRTSNRTLPGIQSASWLPDGSVAFVRYLSGADFSTINTYALSANDAGGGGFFLSQDLADIAVSSTNVLSLASGVNGSVASVQHTDGTRATAAFTTPLSSIRVSFAGKDRYLAYTKPAATLSGSAFLVGGARFSRVAGPRNGLVALASPLGGWVLVSYVSNTAMQMELVNAATNEVLPLPVATIADKCVWAADDSAMYCGVPVSPPATGQYPDDWYQGAAAFNDRVWKINVSGRYAQLVFDFSKEASGSLDAEAFAVDALGTTLVFVNKNDGSLWSYSL